MKPYAIVATGLCLLLSACAGAPTPDTEATQQAIAAATLAAQPTDTPVPPTATPAPTDTPVPPTATPAPTDTPVPPTDTPTPTDTPVPPTPTPSPTKTPAPPTATPKSAATPTQPRPTPAPTPIQSAAAEHFGRGLDYFRQEQWDEAIAELEEAIRLDPEFGAAYEALGYSYAFGPGDLVKAIEALEKYLQVVPNAGDRTQVEADIQQIRDILAAQPGISIPPGKGALVMFNCRGAGETVTVDVIPAGIFQALDPKTGEDCTQGEPIFLDPGDYTLKATIAGVPARGESGISIVAGEAVQFTWY